MNTIEFFNSDEVELPRDRTNDDFLIYINDLFNTYLLKLSELKSSDYVTQQILSSKKIITKLCEQILKAIENHLKGFPHLAFKEIELGINEIDSHLKHLFSVKDITDHEPLNQLYRIRIGNPLGTNYKKKDLFHIPFEKRHKVTRQRYSIPGLPCLYLGGSLYVCWEELNRPDFNSIYFSRYMPNKRTAINYLNFGYRPAMIAAMINANPNYLLSPSREADFIIAQAVCWPIQAACSIKRLHADSPFIAEYIIPQLILQWVICNGKCDGIRYFSVKINEYPNSPSWICNYVFPAKEIAATGFCCILKNKFEMTDPISWQFIERTDLGQITPYHGGESIEIVPGVKVLYLQTPFGKIEAKSLPIPCEGIK